MRIRFRVWNAARLEICAKALVLGGKISVYVESSRLVPRVRLNNEVVSKIMNRLPLHNRKISELWRKPFCCFYICSIVRWLPEIAQR